jgi:hypothetical protein
MSNQNRPTVNAIADRINTCKSCPNLNKLNMCKLCGCFMPIKVRLKGSSCPDGKWGAIVEAAPESIVPFKPGSPGFPEAAPKVENDSTETTDTPPKPNN